jgi:hypothetical protein
MVGKNARCKKCNTVFTVETYVAPAKRIEPEATGAEAAQDSAGKGVSGYKTVQERKEECIRTVTEAVESIIPSLQAALERKDSLSDTRLIIVNMLQSVLGYGFEDIKVEHKKDDLKADYVLSVKWEDVIVVEAKRIGMTLKEKHLDSAVKYGRGTGIPWLILTNAFIWQLYRIPEDESAAPVLVFTVDLRDGLDEEETEYFYMISHEGMTRRHLLEKMWKRISALNYENLMNVIVSEPVIQKIRTTLQKETGYRADEAELKQKIEEYVFSLS